MNLHRWFATTVYEEQLDLAPRELEALVEESRGLEQSDGPAHGMIQRDGFSTYHYQNQVLTLPAFAAARAAIVSEVAVFLEALGCDPSDRLGIANSWSNVYHPGASVDLHDHGGAVLSGALYLSTSARDAIFFRNPLLLQFKTTKPFPFAEVQPIGISPGKLVLFPGWLEHRTLPNPGPDDKVVLSFNVVQTSDDANLISLCDPDS